MKTLDFLDPLFEFVDKEYSRSKNKHFYNPYVTGGENIYTWQI